MTSPDLIERLEKAEGGSRELDALVCAALGYHPGFPDYEYLVPWRVEADEGALIGYICPPGEPAQKRWKRPPEPVTTSLDAALALAERVLGKGWSYSIIGEIGGGATVTLEQPDVDLGGGVIASPGLCGLDEFEAEAATPALALCAAILRSRTGEDGR